MGLASLLITAAGSAAAIRRPRRVGAPWARRALAVAATALVATGLTGLAAAAAPPADAAPEEHTTTVRYGPFLLPPDTGDGGGHGGQQVTYAGPSYEMPCRDCYITGIEPDMIYADGSQANYHTGAMLHHLVVFDPSKNDVSCGRQGVGLVTGQRIFAAGNERTGTDLPAGYGYRLGSKPLGSVVELMNMSPRPQQVYLTLQVSWVDADDARLAEVTPVWLDVDNCGDSQYTVPAGRSHTTWTWQSPLAGDIVAVGGHVHDNGISITLSNATREEEICESVAGFGTDPRYRGHIESMSTCTGDPVATVAEGDVLALDSYYDSPRRDDSVMGIMLAYIHQR